MSTAEIFSITVLTLKVGGVATLLILLPGIGLGFLFARFEFPLRSLCRAIVLLPMVLPPVAIGILLVTAFARGTLLSRGFEAWFGSSLLLSWQGAALASAVMAFPLLVLGAENAFAGVPRRVELAAATLGASPLRVFFAVTLPLARRGLLHGLVFAFARALGEFGATTLVAGHVPGETETLALAIYSRIENFDDAGAMGLSLVSIAIALIVIGAAERFLRAPRREVAR